MKNTGRNLSTDTKSTFQYCSFWLDDKQFGIDILDVKEIDRKLSFTPIYHAPDEVKGYVNIRGQIFLVIDLRSLMGFEPMEVTPNSRVIIFKSDVGPSFGVLVDKIDDIIEVDKERIEERMAYDDESHLVAEGMKDLIKGGCKLDTNLLVILNARRFLNAIEYYENRKPVAPPSTNWARQEYEQ